MQPLKNVQEFIHVIYIHIQHEKKTNKHKKAKFYKLIPKTQQRNICKIKISYTDTYI